MDEQERNGVCLAYPHNAHFKVIPRDARLIFHFSAVIIDCIDGITKELGNLRTIVNTQTDQGKNTQFCIQQFALAENDPFLRLQQLIELFYKVREKMEEGSIEVLVQFLQISVKHIS